MRSIELTDKKIRGQLRHTVLAISIQLILAPTVMSETDSFHVGEDGVSYSAQQMGVLQAPGAKTGAETSSTTKIEDALLTKIQAGEQYRLIVYLNLREENHATLAKSAELEAEKIHLTYQEEIETVSDELQDIYKAYLPDQVFAEEDEKTLTESINVKISDADKQLAHKLKLEIDQLKDRMRDEIAEKLNLRSQPTQDEVAAFIKNLGGQVHNRILSSNALAVTLDGELIEKLAEHELVRFIYQDAEVEYELNTSTPTVFKKSSNSSNNTSNSWWANHDAGCAFDLGVVDSGVKTNHPGYNGDPYETCGDVVFSAKPGSTITNGHGTHVTGIVVSRNSAYRGIAPSTETVIWANSGGQSTTMANMDWMVTKSGQKPEVINHSLGYGIANSTDYNANDSFYDAFIEKFDIMVAKSTGNEYWSNTAPTITHPAPAFNLMAVANMNDQGTTSRSTDVRSSSSSVGPTLSNRKKPDISAPGSSITSTHVRWDGNGPTTKCANTGSADYVSCSGTSMAAPHVAGAILLMEDAGVNWPPAQKAVLINTADAWTSNNTSSTSDDGPVSGSHWDKSYGWGYLDLDEARFNRLDYFASSTLDRVVGRNNNNTDNDYKLYKGYMVNNEKATLVWEKRAGNYHAGAPSTSRYALTDLNMRLYKESNGSQMDSDLDANDNVHQVAANSSGNSVIKIYSWSTSISGATYERYALATEENFTRVTPPKLNPTTIKPTWIGPYQTFNVQIGFYNSGQVAAHSSSVSMNNVAYVSGDGSSKSLGSIAATSTKRASYSLTTSNAPSGTLTIPFSGSSNSYAESYTGSGSLVLNVERTAPGSQCTLPQYLNKTAFKLKWQIADTQTGPDRAAIYVKKPGSTSYSYVTTKSTSGAVELTDYVATAGDGLYRFAIRGRDKGGNWEVFPVSAECSIFIDTKKPTATLNAPTIDLGGSVTFSYNVTDPSPSSGLSFVDFWYRKQGTSNWVYTGQFKNTLTGSVSWTPPAGDGRYYLFARPKDKAQNIRAFPASTSIGDDSVLYDTKPPIGTISINKDAAYTSKQDVVLKLSASDANGVKWMRLSNNGTNWTSWRTYASTLNWNLANYGGNTSFGTKFSYIQYRDTAGRVSSTYRDSIIYDKDSDGDGIVNSLDNCILKSNPKQLDSDNDKYGNVCDTDLSNDGITNVLDLNLFRSLFGSSKTVADFNTDGHINVLDLNILRQSFGKKPGPSGLAP